jgi:RNA-directed DNA polymerase
MIHYRPHECRCSTKRLWVLDADLAAAFDRISHDHLMSSLGNFPARVMIRGWLKTGVMEKDRLASTGEGTPQGGVISPLLLNIALHGMEAAAGCRYQSAGRGKPPIAAKGTPILVRYADDYVALCHSEEQARQVKETLAVWLQPRGLQINEEKTRVTYLARGFDFLGFNLRRYGDKLLVKPSNAALKRIRERLRTEVRSLRGANAEALISRLSPIIRGWSAYYRTVVSSEAFAALDHYAWKLTYRWAKRRHPKKPKNWIVKQYFGTFNKERKDKWVFGDRKSGAFLPKFSWTGIVRHVQVKGAASPDDPALATYWNTRRRKRTPPPMDKVSLALAARQKGVCPLCRQALIIGAEYEADNPRRWIEWFAASKRTLRKQRLLCQRDDGKGVRSTLRLVHADCYHQHPEGGSRTQNADTRNAQVACLSRVPR